MVEKQREDDAQIDHRPSGKQRPGSASLARSDGLALTDVVSDREPADEEQRGPGSVVHSLTSLGVFAEAPAASLLSRRRWQTGKVAAARIRPIGIQRAMTGPCTREDSQVGLRSLLIDLLAAIAGR